MKRQVCALLTAALLLPAALLLVGAGEGGQTDPLVTVSYINEVALPKALKDAEAKLDIRQKALKTQLDETIATYQKQLGSAGASGTGTAAVFEVVTLASGKRLIGGTGCEFLLRKGNATCVSPSAPGLIDTTGGATLPAGGTLLQNHLYLATDSGRGLLAAGSVTVMVRGPYTLQ